MYMVSKLSWIMCLCMVSTMLMMGCDESSASKKKGADNKETESKSTDSEDPETTDSEDPETTDSKENGAEDGCTEFDSFVESCDYNAVTAGALLGLCDAFDEIFIDDYSIALMSCISDVGCDQLAEALDDDETDTDADTETTNFLELCMITAFVATEPEEDNQEFKEHFCDYVLECDSNATQSSCDAEFTLLGDLFIYMVLEDKYIKESDACVHPMPDCAEAEETTACIEEVAEGIGDDLDALFGEE